MDKAYHFYLSATNKILTGILMLLGFSMISCNHDDEYGSPYSTYEIKGKVVDEDGKAIPGIQVVLIGTPSDITSSYMPCDTLQSDNKGEFHQNCEIPFGGYEPKWEIITKDIDGEQNGGLFEEKSTEVTISKKDMGEGMKEVTISMEKGKK